MRLFRITRSFSQGFPSDLITNIPTIDAYLHTIEQELPGRQALRCQLLEEVRDHLLEHHAQLIEGGMDSVTAAEQVTEAFGDPVVFGRSRSLDIQWRNADGRSKRLKLPLHDNMNNADLFQARLYTSLEHPQ